MRIFLALLIAMSVSGCLGRGGSGGKSWGMDPRLAEITIWAHAAGEIVTDTVGKYPYVPRNKGTNGQWGKDGTVIGTYYSGKKCRGSHIRTQIDRPSEKHVVDIIAHEIGHYFKHCITGNPSGETYANDINRAIRKLEAEGLIPPAPSIDWDAK